jgi:hypothetical protein
VLGELHAAVRAPSQQTNKPGESGSGKPEGRGGGDVSASFLQFSRPKVGAKKGDALEIVDLVEELKKGGGMCADRGQTSA